MDKKALAALQKELGDSVTLVAVSKTHTKQEIAEAHALGCTIFGENKVQELKEKYDPRLHWHMIGHLQRNKVKDVVGLVDMIQSLDSMRLAEEIEKQCAKLNKIMPVLVEVNISREENKTGIFLEECPSFVRKCMQLPHLDVQGLMCVGPLCEDTQQIAADFEKMNILFHRLQAEFGAAQIRWLSMGMSQDYRIALAHGANMVRIGTTIFGKRNYK